MTERVDDVEEDAEEESRKAPFGELRVVSSSSALECSQGGEMHASRVGALIEPELVVGIRYSQWRVGAIILVNESFS